uniref:Polyribonucleotide nucleotidyltransferase n=2 Tax=Lygus hesperus TaxID=30085 RepID=A0A0A9WGB1_LYGHE
MFYIVQLLEKQNINVRIICMNPNSKVVWFVCLHGVCFNGTVWVPGGLSVCCVEATGGQNSSDQAPPSRSDEPAYRGDRCPERGDRGPERGDRGPERGDRGPERGRRPNPSSSSHHHHPHQPASSGETRRRTRLFGMKGFGFGKTVDRTISLPETETVQYAAGKRPFGMPLVLGAGAAVPVTPPTPTTPRTGKRSA